MSIVVNNLSFGYCTRAVLENVGFSAGDGELLSVLGPNGVGKTTLFRCILGLQRSYSGSILINGENAKELSPRQLAGRVAYISQLHGQPFGYSVLDMVLMGTAQGVPPLAQPKAAQYEAANAALRRLNIEDLGPKRFSHLSGGEQQLVLIARALAQNAKTLLMDEPTASLDYGNQARVLEVAKSLAGEGYTLIMSTHNPQHALWYADRVLALLFGRVAALGRPDEVLDSELIEKLYGMKAELVQTASGPLIAPKLGRVTQDV